MTSTAQDPSSSQPSSNLPYDEQISQQNSAQKNNNTDTKISENENTNTATNQKPREIANNHAHPVKHREKEGSLISSSVQKETYDAFDVNYMEGGSGSSSSRAPSNLRLSLKKYKFDLSTKTLAQSSSTAANTNSDVLLRDNPLARRFQHLNKCVEDYDQLNLLGEGTYGQVYKARDKKTGRIVAVKKIRMEREKEGFPITAVREISILKTLDHPNVVKLLDVVTSRDKKNFFMIFEYIEHDLAGLLDSKVKKFSEAEIKSLMKQLLEALFQCHSHNILHRDLKASNLLITKDGVLKLADFGLARFINPQGKGVYTNRVITRWYRPPELFLGLTEYGPAVDMWSVGCILAEILLCKPIFPGKNEVEQIDKIYEICGTPTKDNWPGVVNLPNWEKMTPTVQLKRRIQEMFHIYPPKAVNLLERLLSLDPAKRPSAKECLDNDWFWEGPPPKQPTGLPEFSCNELSAKKKRKNPNTPSRRHPQTQDGSVPPSTSQQQPNSQHPSSSSLLPHPSMQQKHGVPPHHAAHPPGAAHHPGGPENRGVKRPPPGSHPRQHPSSYHGGHHYPRDNADGRHHRDALLSMPREQRDSRDPRDSREYRDSRRDARDYRNEGGRDYRDHRDREPREKDPAPAGASGSQPASASAASTTTGSAENATAQTSSSRDSRDTRDIRDRDERGGYDRYGPPYKRMKTHHDYHHGPPRDSYHGDHGRYNGYHHRDRHYNGPRDSRDNRSHSHHYRDSRDSRRDDYHRSERSDRNDSDRHGDRKSSGSSHNNPPKSSSSSSSSGSSTVAPQNSNTTASKPNETSAPAPAPTANSQASSSSSAESQSKQ